MLHNQNEHEWTWPGSIKPLRVVSVSMSSSIFIQWVIYFFPRSGLVWTKRACDGESKLALILLLLFLLIFVTCLIYHSHVGSSLPRVIVRIKEINGLRRCIWSMLWQSDHPFSLCSRTNILVPVCHFVCRLLGLQCWSTSFVAATLHFLIVLHFLTYLPHFPLSCCPLTVTVGLPYPTGLVSQWDTCYTIRVS